MRDAATSSTTVSGGRDALPQTVVEVDPIRHKRVDEIDVLRGLVMVVMALDHTREYLHSDAAAFDPTDPTRTSLILFATRWVTYFCAPTFVFLSGLSVWFRRQQANATSITGYLVSRGVWLILMELTLVALGFTFHPGYLFLQVIWVIGASMILLALLVRLPSWTVLGLAITLLLGHDLLDSVRDSDLGAFKTVFAFLDGRFSFISFGPFKGVLLYSLLGWAGIAFLGYGIGPLFRLHPARRNRVLAGLGIAFILAFLVLRFIDRYGDPTPWTVQLSPMQTAMDFMRVSKYPPSLDFVLATLGPMLLLLPELTHWRGKAMEVLRTFGRTPFFYYVLHIYLIHGLATIIGLTQGFSFAQFIDPINPPKNFGFPLPTVFGLWFVVVASLYPACRWFEGVRQRRRDWWLSYL